MKQLLFAATLAGALWMFPMTSSAQDHDQNHENKTYYDSAHKDHHEWNDNENTAWGRYRDEHHIKQSDFAKASKRDQQNYWNWRHEHPDSH